MEQARPRHRANASRHQALYNIYAEIDLTNEQDQPTPGGGDSLFPSSGAAGQAQAQAPRNLPVPHLPPSSGSGRHSRTRSRVEVAYELQVSRECSVASSMYTPNPSNLFLRCSSMNHVQIQRVATTITTTTTITTAATATHHCALVAAIFPCPR